MNKNNENIIKEILLKDILLKLQGSFFMLLDNIKKIKSKNYFYIPYKSPDILNKIESEIYYCAFDLENILENETLKNNTLTNFINYKEEILNISKKVYSYVFYNDKYKNLINNYLLKKSFINSDDINKDDLSKKLKLYLEENEKNLALFIHKMPIKISDESFLSIIKSSLKILFENVEDSSTQDIIDYLNLKVLPNNLLCNSSYYNEISDKFTTLESININNLNKDELLELKDSLEDDFNLFQEIQDYLNTLYESLNYIISILIFVNDINYIFDGNIIYKDIYYTSKELFNTSYKNVLTKNFENLIDNTCENIVDSIIEIENNKILEDITKDNLSSETLNILKIHENIKNIYYENIENLIFPLDTLPIYKNNNNYNTLIENFINTTKENLDKLNFEIKQLSKQSLISALVLHCNSEDIFKYISTNLDLINNKLEIYLLEKNLDALLKNTNKPLP